MKRMTLLILLLAGACSGTTLVLADNGACIQDNYAPMWTGALDPNAVFDALLGPVPNNPEIWTIAPGPWRRPLFTCDPDGDDVQLVLESSQHSAGAIVTDPNGLQWLEFDDVQPPTVWAYITVTDIPPEAVEPKSRTVLIISAVRGENQPPVLY
jgi:hypothetical protein